MPQAPEPNPAEREPEANSSIASASAGNCEHQQRENAHAHQSRRQAKTTLIAGGLAMGYRTPGTRRSVRVVSKPASGWHMPQRRAALRQAALNGNEVQSCGLSCGTPAKLAVFNAVPRGGVDCGGFHGVVFEVSARTERRERYWSEN